MLKRFKHYEQLSNAATILRSCQAGILNSYKQSFKKQSTNTEQKHYEFK